MPDVLPESSVDGTTYANSNLYIVSYQSNEFLFASARLWARTFATDHIGSTIMRGVIGGGIAHQPYRGTGGEFDWFGVDCPDGHRRPVSVKSIAETLGMPYANIWRRVDVLVRAGFLVRAGSGVRLSASTLAGSVFQTLILDDYAILSAKILPLLKAFKAQTPGNDAEPMMRPPANVVMRIALDFHLRRIETFVELFDDMTTGMVFVEISAFNIRSAYEDPALAPSYAGVADRLPDAHRCPIGIREVARKVELPYPTVRRHVKAMAAAGTITLVGSAGYIVPVATLLQPRFALNAAAALGQFVRMADDLRRIGYPAHSAANLVHE